MRRTSLAVLLLLAACQRSPVPDGTARDGGIPPSASGLERAAIETGVIADTGRTSPVGLYQRSHEAGRDTLCIMPDGKGAFRFGAQAMFGEDQNCRGKGHARRAGDKLILSFERADQCIIVAQYDGDQVALPGVVDMKCAALCEGRGSLEGVSFPRIGNDAASALRARDAGGDPLCE